MIHFREIAAHYDLGPLLSAPTPVLGGLLHTTYRLDAAEGSFAAKILNPAVMKRPEALGNMIRSEKIARAMSEFIPAVAAVEKDGCPVSLIGGEYVMLYPWLSCRPVFPPKLNARHAAEIGTVLAKMHDAGSDLFRRGAFPSDGEAGIPVRSWEDTAAEAEKAAPGASWLLPLKEAVSWLDLLEEKSRKAALALPPSVFSHRDLDPKNVLWEGPAPRVIDWESAGAADPASELLEVLLAWADNGEGNLDEGLFSSLSAAYRAVRPIGEENWDAVFDGCWRSSLDWLAYNVRRAAGLEDAPEDGENGHERSSERLVGASEVSGTLRVLASRAPLLESARKWLGV